MTSPPPVRPTIVCLCGSVRFLDAFDAASIRETLAGRIVLSVASTRVRGEELTAGMPRDRADAALRELAVLHLAKIDLADEVMVINVGGYVGESTRREIAHAESTGTPVRYWETPTHQL